MDQAGNRAQDPSGEITLSAAAVRLIQKELDKVNRTERGVDFICLQMSEALELPEKDILHHLQERLSPDVLLTAEMMTDRQVFYALRKILDCARVHVELIRGVPLPNKIVTALYSDIHSFLNESQGMLTNYKNAGVLRKLNSAHVGNQPTPSLTYRPEPHARPVHINGNTYDTDNGEHNNLCEGGSRDHPNNRQQTSHQFRASLAKNRQAVSSGFSSLNAKFSGSPGSGLPLHVVKRRFNELVYEQEIPSNQRVQLIHNCLTGIANEFFYTSVRNAAQDAEEAFKILERRCDSKQHHTQALSYLKRLTISSIKMETSCTDMQALSTAHTKILEYIPQCGPSYQGEYRDGHMSAMLADIVDGENWSEAVLAARITSDGSGRSMDYNTFYNMLVSSIKLRESCRSKLDEDTPVYDGERYGNIPRQKRPIQARFRGRSLGTKPRRTAAELVALKAKTRCLRCNKLGHWKDECQERGPSMTEIIRARTRERGNNDKAAAQVLFAIAATEDDHAEYLDVVGTNEEGGCSAEDNNYGTLFSGGYKDEDAESDLVNTFETLLTATEHEDRDDSKTEESDPGF